ncbi:MAG TPA: hypothetical protein VFD05_00850 [Bacilli bacterium]|nr:hypothetical protein [Bacilli bacterium]
MKKTVFFIPLLLLSSCQKALPKPEVIDGFWGQFGIDKNINVFPLSESDTSSTLDKHLNRKDTVYFDMRMLVDPANYEAIGGDRFLSGFIKGFKAFGYPYIAPLGDLPPEIGEGYNGPTLFSYDESTSKYLPNYKESLNIISEVFPTDKYIFVMCGGGGYAQWTKEFLINLGYDEQKIYNVGCYWNYVGPNDVPVKETNEDGLVTYAFHRVSKINIVFEELHAL